MERSFRSEKKDVCIIGGGVLGCLIAMELSRRSLSCILIEKNEDLCLGISKANSAVLYPGYDQKPGTRKSRFAVEGNRRTAEVCSALGVPFRRCGSLMAVCGKAGERVLKKKYRNGGLSGVPDLVMLGREEALRLEPGLTPEITSALYSPHTAVVYPWRLGMAAAEEAQKAGAEIRLGTKICAIRREDAGGGSDAVRGTNAGRGSDAGRGTECSRGYILTMEDGSEIYAACVVNAAGIFAHHVRELLFAPKIRIRPSMADYLVFGKEENPGLRHVIFYEPEDGKKGITLIPSLNGTILAGATERTCTFGAGAIPFEEPAHATAGTGLRFLQDMTAEIYPALAGTAPIRGFAGLRPNPYEVSTDPNGEFSDTGRSIHDLVIEKETPDGSFVSLLGIKTPGITASVPIAEYVAGIIERACRDSIAPAVVTVGVEEDESECREESVSSDAVRDLPFSEKQRLAEQDPAFGTVICRCEQVTEREVRNAISSGATTVEGVKLRCGAGMGKCQGTRCRKQVEAILEEEKSVRKAESTPAAESALKGDLTCKYLLIGAGAAGLSLAVELADKDPAADILVVDRESGPGGVLVQCLHDGFPEISTGKMLTGTDYLDHLWKEVQEKAQNETGRGMIRCLFGTHITELKETLGQEETYTFPVNAVAATGAGWIRINAQYGILTTGAIERTAGMLLLPGTRPKGVYTAGEVQRMLNLEDQLPGKKAVLVGTGNMGLIMADLMIRKGMEVVRIIEKEDHVTATAGNVKKYLTDLGTVISMDRFLFCSEVDEIHGAGQLQGITVRKPGDVKEYLPCDTLVIAVGLIPDRQLLKEDPCHDPVEDLYHIPDKEKRIFLFGNCEHIYTSVSAMRIAAGQLAEEIVG